MWKGQELLDICEHRFKLTKDTVQVFDEYLKAFRQQEEAFGDLSAIDEEDQNHEKALDGSTMTLLNSLFQAVSYDCLLD